MTIAEDRVALLASAVVPAQFGVDIQASVSVEETSWSSVKRLFE